MAQIHIERIVKSYGATEVLKNISFQIHEGEFISLVGPSGCGKSTLLRIISGLEQQDSGSITIAGERVDAQPPKDRDLAMVFQSYALYPHLSVFDNIAVPLRMRRLNAFQRLPLVGRLAGSCRRIEKQIADAVADVADMLDIGHLLNRKPGQLSGGQRQRVAVGRAIVRDPKAFLMDEPLSNLDSKLRVHMRTEIAQLHKRLAATFIYVTHDQAEAMTMSDRIAVMMEGKILQLGTPSQIYNRPGSIKVAEFIGSPPINILPARVMNTDLITVAGKPVSISVNRLPDKEVVCGIRPESLKIVSPDDHSLTASVAFIENLGSDYLVHATVSGMDRPVIVREVPDVAAGLTEGDRIGLFLPPESIMLFERGGCRIETRLEAGKAEEVGYAS